MSAYEIYALKYAGPFERKPDFLLWLNDAPGLETIDYFIWAVQNQDRTVVVDAGVSPALAAERELGGYVSPARVLARIGIRAEEAEHLFLTHLHWDHSDGLELFPRATVYVHRREYEFWVTDPLAKRGPFAALSVPEPLARLAELKEEGRVVLVEGDQEILPGLTGISAPGHTLGLMALGVETDQGQAILGSDCGHMFQNYKQEWPSCLITDLWAWVKSYAKLKSLVAQPKLLFPGHDHRMLTEYPKVAEDVTRLV